MLDASVDKVKGITSNFHDLILYETSSFRSRMAVMEMPLPLYPSEIFWNRRAKILCLAMWPPAVPRRRLGDFSSEEDGEVCLYAALTAPSAAAIGSLGSLQLLATGWRCTT